MSQILEEIKNNLREVKVYEKVKITPHIATQILEMNIGNRRVDDYLVKNYAQQMRKGDWEFTGNPIMISRTGKLLNTQHTLYAIVASQTTQVINIQTGLLDKIFDVLDTGKNRTPADVLSIKGYANPGTLQAAVKLIKSYYAGKMERNSKGLGRHERMTNHEVLKWLEGETNELITECVSEGQSLYSKCRIFSSPTYAAFLYIFSKKSREEAREFFTKLATGESLAKGSPIYALRNRITNLKLSNKFMAPEEKYALIIKAWNFCRDKKTIDRILWTEEEDFPKVK